MGEAVLDMPSCRVALVRRRGGSGNNVQLGTAKFSGKLLSECLESCKRNLVQ